MMQFIISSKQHCRKVSVGHAALGMLPVTEAGCVDRCILCMARLGQ